MKILPEIQPDAQTEAYFERAVSTCRAWFGSPTDINWPTRYFLGRRHRFFRNRFEESYGLVLPADFSSRVELAFDLSSSSFMRIVGFRKTIGSRGWVEELLHMQATHRLMKLFEDWYRKDPTDYEISNYVAELELAYEAWSNEVRLPEDINDIEKSHVRIIFRAGSDRYRAAVWQLGCRLVNEVGWDAVCRMAVHSELSSWLDEIPYDSRCRIAQILPEKLRR